jgi:hypothetical protein
MKNLLVQPHTSYVPVRKTNAQSPHSSMSVVCQPHHLPSVPTCFPFAHAAGCFAYRRFAHVRRQAQTPPTPTLLFPITQPHPRYQSQPVTHRTLYHKKAHTLHFSRATLSLPEVGESCTTFICTVAEANPPPPLPQPLDLPHSVPQKSARNPHYSPVLLSRHRRVVHRFHSRSQHSLPHFALPSYRGFIPPH